MCLKLFLDKTPFGQILVRYHQVCKAGVFCSTINDFFFSNNNVILPSWRLIYMYYRRIVTSQKLILREKFPPPFLAPPPLLFSLAFQDGRRDQCTSKFPLKNACSAGQISPHVSNQLIFTFWVVPQCPVCSFGCIWNRRKHKISSGNYEQRLESWEMWLWGKDLNISWSWSDSIGHTLWHGYLQLLRGIDRTETTWKVSSGNAGQSEGRQPLYSRQEVHLRSGTIQRKDLPVGRKHTHTMSITLGYFHRERKGNRTKRTSQLFNSLPTNFTQPSALNLKNSPVKTIFKLVPSVCTTARKNSSFL